MAERITSRYQALFQVRVLHHYWLDNGSKVFDRETNNVTRQAQLARYDVRRVFSISPTAGTAATLKGLGCRFVETRLGFSVFLPAERTVPADEHFDFVVTLASPAVGHYTVLTLEPRLVREFTGGPDKRRYRYKEHVPLLSNLTGAARGSGGGKQLFLSRDYPALRPGDRVESLFASQNEVRQITSDPPNPSVRSLGPITQMPVYVHQDDVPEATPPPDLQAVVPPTALELTDDLPDDVFAVIRLAPSRSDDDDFSFVDASGRAKAIPPIFQVRFLNRATIWQYRDQDTGSIRTADAPELPLTFYGNAGTKRKPAIEAMTVDPHPDDPSRIVQLISEIYV